MLLELREVSVIPLVFDVIVFPLVFDVWLVLKLLLLLLPFDLGDNVQQVKVNKLAKKNNFAFITFIIHVQNQKGTFKRLYDILINGIFEEVNI